MARTQLLTFVTLSLLPGLRKKLGIIIWWKCNCNWWFKLKALWKYVLIIFGCYRFVNTTLCTFFSYPQLLFSRGDYIFSNINTKMLCCASGVWGLLIVRVLVSVPRRGLSSKMTVFLPVSIFSIRPQIHFLFAVTNWWRLRIRVDGTLFVANKYVKSTALWLDLFLVYNIKLKCWNKAGLASRNRPTFEKETDYMRRYCRILIL